MCMYVVEVVEHTTHTTNFVPNGKEEKGSPVKQPIPDKCIVRTNSKENSCLPDSMPASRWVDGRVAGL